MLELIASHPAATALLAYLLFSAVVGSMPKLPEGASWKAQWGYGILQALSLNIRFALNFFKIPTPPKDE